MFSVLDSSPIRLAVITNNSCPNSRAFNFPLLFSKKILREKKYALEFIFTTKPAPPNCDIIFVNSNVFRPYWKKNKNAIFEFLENSAKKKIKIFWFDTTDSTWCTQFEVMPYVDKFLKAQIFVDKTMYLQRFRTGRIYTDFFDKLYDSGENCESYQLPSKNDLNKIELSWNSCFENYNEQRYSLSGKIKNILRPYYANFANEKLNLRFSEPTKDREIKVSCRVGTSHSRPSVAAHRKTIMERLSKYGITSEKISLAKYFAELRNSQISVSPFGVGEITLRDYESIICGTCLLKPDMTHLSTWPNLFRNQAVQTPPTCLIFKWDLSDLDEKIDLLLSNPDRRVGIAENAQKIYRHHLSEEGIAEFAERLCNLIAR
jgi:hypothetical protein